MKRILFILLGLLPLLGWAQPKLSPAESKARLQQLGDSLRKYDYFENFDRFGWSVVGIRSDKNAKNQFPDRYGIINDYGQVILPCEYSDIRFQEHSDLMMVIKGEKAGFMNRQLEWVIPPKYSGEFWADMDRDDFFEYGMIEAANLDERYGVVDSTGREILPCRYKGVNIVGPDFFVVEDDHYGAINRNSDTIIPFVYQSLRPLYASDGLYFEVMNQDKHGVISNTGKEIIPCIYERVGDSEKGYFALKQAGKWGVLDSVGRIILPFENDVLYLDLLDGADMIGMRTKDGRIQLIGKKWEATFNPSNDYLISKSGEYIAVISYESGECMIYDRNGKIVDTFEKFVRDETDLVDGITMIPVKRNGKWGFVNRDFQLIVPCIYDAPAEGWAGYGYVNTGDGLTTLIDEQGQQLVSGPYRFISSPTVNGWFMVGGYPPDSWNGITGFIDRYGNSTFTEEETVDRDDIESSEYTLPDFPGGMDSLHHYLARNITLPEDAREKGVFGTVLAHFVVEKDGSIGEVSIKVPLYPSCDEEVKRVLMQMPRWTPGTNQGLPERRYYAIPVTFLRPDTIYPKIITDAVLIDSLKAILKSSASPDEDFTRFNLEEADYYQLGNYYVVRCMLAGLVSGYGSNFQHYFVIDVQNRKDFYFMSLSNNMKNMYIAGDLIINSVDYADGYNDDSQYFKKKKATFKLTTQRISTTDLQVKKTKQSDAKLDWREVSGWRLY